MSEFPPPVPVFGPITFNTREALREAKGGLIKSAPYLAAGIAIANADEILEIVEDLLADALRTLTVTSQQELCSALRAWGRDLEHLAEVMLSPVADAGADVVQMLVIEVLRIKFARLASMLSLAGAIVDNPHVGAHFDFEKLRDFMLATPDLVDESFWDELFGAGDESSRMLALLVATLIVAPETLAALNTGDLTIAPLESPPTATTGSPQWRALRERSSGWIPITLPLTIDDEGGLGVADGPDLRGGFDPELALSVLIRSQRRPSGGRTVTDFETWVHPSVDAERYEVRTSSNYLARVEPGVRLGLGYDGSNGTWNAAIAPRPGSPVPVTTNEATVRIARDTTGDEPDIVFGPPYDTRVVARDVSAELHLRELGEPSVEAIATIEGLGLVITNRWFRSLGEKGSRLREGLRFNADLEARLTEGAGFSFSADGALAARIHIDRTFQLSVLKLTVHSILVNVPIHATQDQFDIRVEVRPHWSAQVAFFTLVVDGAGGWLGWWADEPGGDKDCGGLLPPTGIGAVVDFPAFSGGGFLEYGERPNPNDRYAGVLTLRFGSVKGLSRFTATAFGLHELTGVPGDVDRGRSFVLVVGTSFRPGIPIGYGIRIIGIGGIIGVDRRADTDALRERLTSGAVGNILFAEDPVRNAPILLGDLAALFPVKPGYHVLGLTVQLGWLALDDEYLVRLAIGVIVELDSSENPTKAILLGSLNISVPGHEGFLDVKVDAIGVLDFQRHTLEIDATIRRGVVMGLFKISGDGGVRSSWGDTPYLMATLGGFHPKFHPEPAVFPKLNRIVITVDKSHLPDAVELSASGYMAVTSNTIQFGATFTASIKSGNWKIEGSIGGDALIRQPFAFDVEIRGGVHVKYRGHNLIGVSFKGGLAGPDPLVLRGEVCISLLLFDACWRDSYELGGDDISGPVITSLVPVLADEMTRASNLTVSADDDRLVLLRHDEEPPPRPVLSPLGVVTWSQSRMPLGLEIDTFEDGKLAKSQRVEVHASVPTDAFLDWFSPGTFVELEESEELALPAFERQQAGVTVRPPVDPRATPTTVPVSYEEIRLPSPIRHIVDGLLIPGHVLERMEAKDAPPSIRPGPTRFTVDEEAFTVETATGTVVLAGEVAAHVAGRATSAAKQHVADRLVAVVSG
ncbi:MAG: DUF6603 domain-containing protein [Pseudomonadota bacterium]